MCNWRWPKPYARVADLVAVELEHLYTVGALHGERLNDTTVHTISETHTPSMPLYQVDPAGLTCSLETWVFRPQRPIIHKQRPE